MPPGDNAPRIDAGHVAKGEASVGRNDGRFAHDVSPTPKLAAGSFADYAASMSIVAFDTLKFANQLQAGNFTAEQAQAMTSAMVEAMAGAELATKHDIAAIKADIVAVEHRLEKKIDAVIADAAATKAELKNDIATLGLRMTIKLGGMLIVVTGILLAAIRYLGH